MLEFITYSILSYGIVNIAVFSSIFEPWRNFWDKISPGFFGKLFSCPMCLSYWVGVVLSITLQHYNSYTPSLILNTNNFYLDLFLDGSITSGLVWCIYVVVNFLETFKD